MSVYLSTFQSTLSKAEAPRAAAASAAVPSSQSASQIATIKKIGVASSFSHSFSLSNRQVAVEDKELLALIQKAEKKVTLPLGGLPLAIGFFPTMNGTASPACMQLFTILLKMGKAVVDFVKKHPEIIDILFKILKECLEKKEEEKTNAILNQLELNGFKK